MNYAALKANLIIPKITAYGKAVIIRRPGVSSAYTKTFDPGQGRYYWTLIAEPHTVTYTDPATTTTDIPGHAVEVKWDQGEVNNTTIYATDRKLKIADVANITSADKLVVSSKTLTIVSVLNTEPGDTSLLYTLQCRG
jgi:subtilase family serine protease